MASTGSDPTPNPTAESNSAATQHAEGGSAATQHTEEPQLAELVTPEAGMSTEIDLKVIRNEVMDYTYTWKGKEVKTAKLQVILQSKIAWQYCLGVAKQGKKDHSDIKAMATRWQIGTTWKFTTFPHLNEKPAYIHTACRIAVDLRKAKATSLATLATFPQAPVPTATIADILELQQMQRFDLMALVSEIMQERGTGKGMKIVDARLVDGSKQPSDTQQLSADYASLPLTLFFRDAQELDAFKQCVGKIPLIFMCLAGGMKDGGISVSTIKDQTWWQQAAGSKATILCDQAAELCGDTTTHQDVAALPVFIAASAADYSSPMATLTTCQIMDTTNATPGFLLGDATEHLYQLNHVYVMPPTKETNIKTKDDRLFARFDVWDHTKKISLAFRSKAMLQLAALEESQTAEYEQLINNDELRHPLLASLRIHVQNKPPKSQPFDAATEHTETQSENILSAIVVEAVPCTFADIPNQSVEAIHGLLAGNGQTSDRLAVVALDKLTPSAFYNMLADGKPVEKALALLHFTLRGNGKQHAQGFRVVTERVQDATAGAATEPTAGKYYATIALCTIEKIPDFSAAKDTTFMAVISKVVPAAKPEMHAADIYIEAMEPVAKHDVASSTELMRKLQHISAAQSADPVASAEVAWQQRKCRRLLRYPTMEPAE